MSVLQCVIFLRRSSSTRKSSTPNTWVPFIDLNNSTKFCESKAALSLTHFLCTLSKADFNVFIEYFGFSDDEKPKQLPTEYTLIVENLRNNVLENTEQNQKKKIVKRVTRFIFEMINATNTKDGSWPGEIHALVLSKMLKIRIVIVSNYWMGLEGWFDTDNAFFDDITSGLLNTISSPAPKDQKKCYLYQVNSKFSPYTCNWTNAMNHFEYLQETSDDVLTNNDKQHTYKGRGGIDMRCYPFDLHDEPWEALVKRLALSSEDSNQASSLLLTKKATSKEISKDTLIASITKNDISTVQACAWHQANKKKDFVCSINGMNLSQCGYLDSNCSFLVHRECAIECCRAVGIVYTLEDGKSAKCPNHHESLKNKLNSF